ncbi:hypothetical protein AAFF_G00198250 [Aldrovandia affinis]|uniref:Uncharacterized protein n=1 Tax=Aldrovandia affinis TaxID=143900 RepID=A0AAD7W657_9TELE|nr:hypothetical protein AAFF_G00198250 [Aldrovandia affinis]
MSEEDIKFLDILNNSTKVQDGHYCLNLPFRQEDPVMPNNRSIAEQRLLSLKRKFGRNAFLAPFTLPANLLQQELCRRNYGWDEDIPQVFSQQWTKWLMDLKTVGEFKVDRCFKPKDFGLPIYAELHHFSDTSEDGYGTVSYLRLENI